MRQLKKLFAISSLILLGGCLRPDKPIVEVCQLDGGASEGICGKSGSGANTQTIRKPIVLSEPDGIDKSTCFPPTQWKSYKSYIDLMEAYATQLEQSLKNCKK